MERTFASLKHRNYRIWFLASLIGNIGTWMQFIAQDWIVLAELTKDNAFAVGLVSALQLTPTMLFLPFTGLLVDRFDRRKILLMTQGALALLAAGLGALVLTGEVQVWHVAVFAFASGTAASIDMPSRAVFVSELVPAEDLPNAVGLNSTSFNLGRLVGPGASGLLIAAVGSGWVFLVNAVTFGFTIAAVLAVRPSEYFTKSAGQAEPAREGGSAASRRGRFREGLRYVRQRPDLAVIFVVAGTVSCLCMNYQLTSAAMARTVFGLEAGEYGILGSLLGAGSLSGALLAARRVLGAQIVVAIQGPACAHGGHRGRAVRRHGSGQRGHAHVRLLRRLARVRRLHRASPFHERQHRRPGFHVSGDPRPRHVALPDGHDRHRADRLVHRRLGMRERQPALGRGNRRRRRLRRGPRSLRVGQAPLGSGGPLLIHAAPAR